MKKEANNRSKAIVSFDSAYMLTAVFRSISEASAMTGLVRQSLIKAAAGELVSVGGRYWRTVPDDLVIESEDIGQLTIFEFDDAAGEDRRIYGTRKMLRGSVMFESEYATIIKSKKQK